MSAATATSPLVTIGRTGFHTLRDALVRTLGDQAASTLQEVGLAMGAELYGEFERWLMAHAGIADAGELDAAAMGEALSAFFAAVGWGHVTVAQLGSAGLDVQSDSWAEAVPGAGAPYPSCLITAGLLSDFMTRLAGGAAVAVMEVECRSRGDTRCRFIAGAPQTLEAAYQAMEAGEDFEKVFRR